MNTCQRGTMAECICSADLLSKGYEVYKSITHVGSVDLIIKKADIVLSVEVRRGKRTVYGEISINKRNKANILAGVDHENKVNYFLGSIKTNHNLVDFGL